MLTKYPEFEDVINRIKDDLYVDDLITGDFSTERGRRLKDVATMLFKEACIELHKWHSNQPSLEDSHKKFECESTYAKEQLGDKEVESKILGLSWDKENDNLHVKIPQIESETTTKRKLLTFLASIYDPLGIISPVMLLGKDLYRQACEQNVSWDERLSEDVLKSIWKWQKATADICYPQKYPTFHG